MEIEDRFTDLLCLTLNDLLDVGCSIDDLEKTGCFSYSTLNTDSNLKVTFCIKALKTLKTNLEKMKQSNHHNLDTFVNFYRTKVLELFSALNISG